MHFHPVTANKKLPTFSPCEARFIAAHKTCSWIICSKSIYLNSVHINYDIGLYDHFAMVLIINVPVCGEMSVNVESDQD